MELNSDDYELYQSCQSAAYQFDDVKQWRESGCSLHGIAVKNRFTRRLLYKPPITKEDCFKSAEGFNSEEDFMKGDFLAYRCAEVYRWLDEICLKVFNSTMRGTGDFKPPVKVVKTKLRMTVARGNKSKLIARLQKDITFRQCQSEARKFNDIDTWLASGSALALLAQENKWPERKLLRFKPKFDYQACKAFKKQFRSRANWLAKHEESFRCAVQEGWIDKLYGREGQNFCFPSCYIAGHKFEKSGDWSKKGDKSAYERARKNRWLCLIIPPKLPTLSC